MKISLDLLKAIEKTATAALPGEACGLLAGGEDGKEILRAIPSPNKGKEKDEFLIDPIIHLNLQRKLRVLGQEIIGVYHSHPSGDSSPSRADKKGPSQPGFYWLITAPNSKNRPESSLFCEIPVQNPSNSRNFRKVPLQILKKRD